MKNPATYNWKDVSSALLDEQAERDLLGYMILAHQSPDPAHYREDLFAIQDHRDIAGVILRLVEHHITVEYLEIVQQLRRNGKTVSAAYISDLTQGVVLARPIERRIAYLRELRLRRKLAALAESLAERAPNLADPVSAIVASVLEAVNDRG